MMLLLQDLPDMPEWELVFKTDGSVDRRRYNAPTAGEVAGFMPGGCPRVVVGAAALETRARSSFVRVGHVWWVVPQVCMHATVPHPLPRGAVQVTERVMLQAIVTSKCSSEMAAFSA
jgi:hypothetical protein